MSHSESWRCVECDEEVAESQLSCGLCGTKKSKNSVENENPHQGQFDVFREETIFERLSQGDFFADLMHHSAGQNRYNAISKQAVQQLGKVVVCPKKLILYDCTLQVGHLRFLVIPAIFSVIPEKILSGRPLLWGRPEFGDIPSLENADECRDAIVILRRGKAPFLSKAITAQRSSAACVIICQSYDIWPFQMTASEVDSEKLSIPCFMLSKRDTEVLERILSSGPSDEIEGTIDIGLQEMECAVCRDDFVEGCEVLKLPCRHVFHSECILCWLDRESSCPMCRQELQSEREHKASFDPHYRDDTTFVS